MPSKHIRAAAMALALVSGLSAGAAQSHAALLSTTFALSDLVFTVPGGQNGWLTPITITEPGVDGHFVWQYNAGDFQNGTGTLIDLLLPFTNQPLGAMLTTADLTSVTGTRPGNVHDIAYDFVVQFTPTLTSPSSTATTSGGFDFTGTYLISPGFGITGEWIGSITGGSVAAVVPEPSLLAGALALAGPLAARRRARSK